MSNKIPYQIYNGDILETLWYAVCPYCGEEVDCSHPHHETKDGTVVCWDCSFIHGYLTEKEFLQYINPYMADRAVVHEGKIYYATKNYLYPWEREKKDRDRRNSPSYAYWRKKVFDRDDYTCALCGQRGGELNAHHIKPYAKYPEDRFKLENGITLCKKCHRKVHKEKNIEWLHP